MNSKQNRAAIISAFIVSVIGLVAAASPKYIFSSWDLGDVTPQEILKYADLFDRTACDGVAIRIGGALPGCDSFRSRRVMNDPGWKYEEVAGFEKTFRAIVKHPSLRESMLSVNLSPTNRLAWTDDRAWNALAGSLRTLARLAKRGGLKGLVLDFEDYWRQKQYLKIDADGLSMRKILPIARRRAREIFMPVFDEFPDAVLLTFQLLTTDLEYARTDDPVALMLEKEDLWPAFVNGIFDVLPSGAKIVDGNESRGYMSEASKGHFYQSVRDQLLAVMPLVAKENRVKYRSQVSVSHGLYMDSYAVPTNSPYYFGPVRGRRINHFEDNLRQATACSDEYVWFWGEKGFWIDWPADLKEQSGDVWRSSGQGTWRRKYYEGSWGRIRPWRETLDGDFDLMARGVKDPLRCVREQYVRQKADGTFANLVKTPPKPNAQGHVHCRIEQLAVDGWYGIRIFGRGEIVRGNAYFQWNRRWRWNLGGYRLSFGRPDADGWREGLALVRIPDGATDIFAIFEAKKDDETTTVEFRDLEVFRIK